MYKNKKSIPLQNKDKVLIWENQCKNRSLINSPSQQSFERSYTIGKMLFSMESMKQSPFCEYNFLHNLYRSYLCVISKWPIFHANTFRKKRNLLSHLRLRKITDGSPICQMADNCDRRQLVWSSVKP